jgi:small-conductance mechanosensitive channel
VSAGPAQNILAPIRTATAEVRAASSRDQTPAASPAPAATQAPSALTAHPELLSNSKATVDLLTQLVSVSGDSHATLKDLHQTTQDAAKQAQQGLQDQQSNTGGTPTVLAPTINQVLGANNKDNPDDGLDVSKKREPRYAA